MKLFLFKAFGNFIIVRAKDKEDAIELMYKDNQKLGKQYFRERLGTELSLEGETEIIYEELS